MGAMHVREFMSLDGVIDAPTWTVDYEFLPEMEKTLGAVTGLCRGILLGRTTYEMSSRRAPTERWRTIQAPSSERCSATASSRSRPVSITNTASSI